MNADSVEASSPVGHPPAYRRLLTAGLVLAAFVALLFVWRGAAYAYGGPHGNYDATTGDCAACHRIHQARSQGKLLKVPSAFSLCVSCHNGTGSVLDVLDGTRLDAIPGAKAGVSSILGSPAYTGSFANAAPDNPGTSTPSFDSATIAHASDVIGRADLTPYSVWITPAAQPQDASNNSAVFTLYVKANSAGVSAAIAAGTPVARDGTGAPTTNHFGSPAIGSTPLAPAYPDSGGSSLKSAIITIPKGTAAAGETLVVPLTVISGGAQANLSIVTWVDNNYNAVLLGGGFEYVNGKRVTSRHPADPAWGFNAPWGYAGAAVTSLSSYAAGTSGATGQTSQKGNTLAAANVMECIRCHDPHGTTNYRLLKTRVNGIGVTLMAFDNVNSFSSTSANFVADEPNKDYINERWGSLNGGLSNDNSSGGFANFCGGCHTAYPSEGAGAGLTGSTTNGNPANPSETHYRHRTEMPWNQWADPRMDTFVRSNPEALGYTPKGGSSVTKLPLANTPKAGTTAANNPNYQNNTITNSAGVWNEWADGSVAASAPGNGAPAAYVVTCVTCHRPHGTEVSVSPVGIAGGYSPLGAPSPAQGVGGGATPTAGAPGWIVSNAVESGTASGTVSFAIAGSDTLSFTYGGQSKTTAALTAATANSTTLSAVASDLQAKMRAAAGDSSITVLATGLVGVGNDQLIVNGPLLLTITGSTNGGLNSALSGKSNGDLDNSNTGGLAGGLGPPTFHSTGVSDQSTLLRVTERGVCEVCHQWGGKGDGTAGP